MYAGWVEAAVNPMTFVVVKGRSKRKKRPRSLTIEEFQRFLEQLGGSPIVKMIAIVCASFGLRISEALGLRRRNLDPKQGMLVIERAIVRQVEDEVKTEYSGRPMPVDQFLLAALLEWKQTSQFSGVDDWIFASPFRIGRNPLSYPQVWKVFQRAAHSAGLDGFGTHTLRHSYRSWLDSIGTQLSVQQKLMRHADIRTTMNVYGDVVTKQESEALAQISSFTLGKQHATARTIN
jgi:integrase